MTAAIVGILSIFGVPAVLLVHSHFLLAGIAFVALTFLFFLLVSYTENHVWTKHE